MIDWLHPRAMAIRTPARAALDRHALVAWYRENRDRSRALFDLLTEEAYYSRPIALRHPIVFYEGHLPGFSFNTLVKRTLGLPGIDAGFELVSGGLHDNIHYYSLTGVR